jgi:hypothetical protein
MTTADKFKKLSEKIAQLNNNKALYTPPEKAIKLESKVKDLESTYKIFGESLELKYVALKDHTQKLKDILEEEKTSYDDLRQTYISDVRDIEKKVKSQITEEKEYMKNLTENLFKKLETQLMTVEKSVKYQSDIMRRNVNKLKEYIESDFPELKRRSDTNFNQGKNNIYNFTNEVTHEFNKINDIITFNNQRVEEDSEEFNSSLQTVVTRMKEEFKNEENERNKFEENILNILTNNIHDKEN